MVILALLLLVLPAAGQYAGSQACRDCHAARFEEQAKSGHARALHKDGDRWAFGGEQAITWVTRVDDVPTWNTASQLYARTKALARSRDTPTTMEHYRTFQPKSQIMPASVHSMASCGWRLGTLVPPSRACCGATTDPRRHVRAGGGKATSLIRPGWTPPGSPVLRQLPPISGGRRETDWNNPWNVGTSSISAKPLLSPQPEAELSDMPFRTPR
jgi:hypothetical protein